MKALGLKRSVFDMVMKQLDSFFIYGLHKDNIGQASWIGFEGDSDPRARLCEDLGMVSFDSALVKKVLGEGSHDMKTTGYLLYQVARASEKRTLLKAIKRETQEESNQVQRDLVPKEEEEPHTQNAGKQTSSPPQTPTFKLIMEGAVCNLITATDQLENHMQQLVRGINLRMAREILVKINGVLGSLEDREWATGSLAM